LGAVVGGGTLLLLVRRSRRRTAEEEEYYEVVEEDEVPFRVKEEENECPESVKKKLLEYQSRLFKEAHKVYLVITNAFQGKTLPPHVKEELETFLRSYNRIKELREEIEVYPFGDCDKVFHLKFNFYQKLIKETAKRLMLMARSLR